MYQSSQLVITSQKALLSTIQTDAQVYRWFLFLILQKNVREEFGEQEELKSIYSKIELFLKLEKFIYLLFLCVLVGIGIWGVKYVYLIVIVIGGKEFLSFQNKKNVCTVCEKLIDRDFKQFDFEHKTLFQIGEWYKCKYNIFSLLEAIMFVSSFERKVMLYVIVFATFIIPLNFWYSVGVFLMAYFIASNTVKMDFFYNQIK